MKFVSSLSELEVKDKGEIAYLHAKDNSQMQKLMSIGVLPGMSVNLLQKFFLCVAVGPVPVCRGQGVGIKYICEADK